MSEELNMGMFPLCVGDGNKSHRAVGGLVGSWSWESSSPGFSSATGIFCLPFADLLLSFSSLCSQKQKAKDYAWRV